MHIDCAQKHFSLSKGCQQLYVFKLKIDALQSSDNHIQTFSLLGWRWVWHLLWRNSFVLVMCAITFELNSENSWFWYRICASDLEFEYVFSRTDPVQPNNDNNLFCFTSSTYVRKMLHSDFEIKVAPKSRLMISIESIFS